MSALYSSGRRFAPPSALTIYFVSGRLFIRGIAAGAVKG